MGVGVLCIVATAGAATPLVVAGAVAGGGTILFGGAEIMEGSQNIYYGASGDMQSSAFNPIRDTVFLGNQGVYDFTKNAFVFAAGAMIPIGSAYSAGTLTLRSGSVIVAEELLSEGAGFAVSKAGEAMDLNPTATMLLSIAASMGTSAGLTKLDQALNVSGCFPKIDVTAPNPASMMDPSGSLTTNASKTAKLSIEEAEELAFNAVHGPSKSDIVVLGKFDGVKDANGNFIKDANGKVIPTENSYNVIAQDMGAQYFQLDNWDDLASKYEGDEIWKINERYLDIQTSSGREIYLTNNPNDFIDGKGFYTREVNYLLDNGYTFVKEGDFWHAVR